MTVTLWIRSLPVAAVTSRTGRLSPDAHPVAATQTCDEFRDEGVDIVCLRTPEPFQAVGLWYDDFSQTTDEEVHELLQQPAHD